MTREQLFVIEKTDDNQIKGGKAIKEAIDDLNPGRWVIGIKRYIKSRTPAQNRLIHMYFGIIADETGNELQRVKDTLKKQFLTTELKDAYGEIVFNPKTGEPLTYVRDTSDLNTIEEAKFTEEVRIFALDFGIILPLPEDKQSTLNF